MAVFNEWIPYRATSKELSRTPKRIGHMGRKRDVIITGNRNPHVISKTITVLVCKVS
jgi:hypothetical protein